MNFTYDLLLTDDGSHTVKWNEKGVTFHSQHGALTESRHVFIDHGLRYILQEESGPVSIFEMGFGTGLNAVLSYIISEQIGRPIHYHAVEAYPLPRNLLFGLNYPDLLDIDRETFMQFHQAADGLPKMLSKTFTLSKTIGPIENFKHKGEYDLIYFDAFGPGAQPHLWEESILNDLYRAMKPDGALVTFCAQGAFKRTLKAIGFEVEALPGPPGKREMTRAVVC